MMRKVAIGICVILIGCTSSNDSNTTEPEVDQQKLVALGSDLFGSTFLSLDSSISCASCHIPSYAFADSNAVSKGIHAQMGFRNTPSLFNVGAKSHFFEEGGVRTLERATIGPMLTEEEMSVQAPELLRRIKSNDSIHQRVIEVFTSDFEYRDIVAAIVAFQESLVSLDAPYDRIESGKEQPSSQWLRGKEIFFSDKAQCGDCHQPPYFRDTLFHDVGMPIAGDPDFGRGRLTFDSTDFYTFSTPSLRNVELTAPYMHNGSIATLDSVIRFYEVGGAREAEIHPFTLSDEDREALLVFLRSLTGDAAKESYN